MEAIRVRNINIEPDYSRELEPYLEKLEPYHIRGNKLQACSPFRHERRPSFAVNLETGMWIDSGSTEDRYRKGNFVSLLSFFREETLEDTELYLLETYNTIIREVDGLELNLELSLTDKGPYKIFSKEELDPYMWRVPYLGNRGITEEVQRIFRVGYDKENKAVMIPWADYKGNIVNLKFRSTTNKRFWYHEDGQLIRNHIFGLHLVFKKNITRVFCTESETDAMYLWSVGVPAIAFGRAGMSKEQKKLILRSPIEELVIASDNDIAGRAFAKRLRQELLGNIFIENFNFPLKYKDINDIPIEELLPMIVKKVEKQSFLYAFATK